MLHRLFMLAFAFFVTTGFSLNPMSHVIRLEDKQTQAQFMLDNPTSEPMAVEVSVRDRIQLADGKEDTPVSHDISVFPPQLIIPAYEKRSVRVQWRGKKPKTERAFRVIAEQLPLQVDGKKKKGSGIKMLLKYVAALYVNPGDTEAKLSVSEIIAGNELTVVLENQGSEHQMLINPTLTLTKGTQKIRLSGDALKSMAGENMLAGSRRIFRIPSVPAVTNGFQGTIKVD